MASAAPMASAEVVHLEGGHFLGVSPHSGINGAQLPGAVAKHELLPRTASAASGQLDDHGGPVVHSSAPYLIFWTPPGQSVPATTTSLFGRYFADVAAAGAGVNAVGRQYTDASGFAGAAQTFSTASQTLSDTQPYPARDTTGCPDVSTRYPICLTDTQLQSELTRELSSARLPDDGPAGESSLPAGAPIYFVVLPSDVNVCFTDSGQTSCADNAFCAYHASLTGAHGHTVLYAAIPTVMFASGQNPKYCQWDGNPQLQEPNRSIADVAIKYLNHEDTETITDPLGNGWWNTATGNEEGDECNAYGDADPAAGTSPKAFAPVLGGSAAAGTLYDQLIHGDEYYVQSTWSDGDGGCLLGPPADAMGAGISGPAGVTAPGQSITLTPSADAQLSSATWAFGDGSPAAFQGPGHALDAITHTFTAAGTYAVTVTLVDSHGNLTTATRQVTVEPAPVPAFSMTTTAPGSGRPTAVSAADSSDAAATITTYAWQFGDGSTGTGASATHIYASPGTYTVTLTITDSLGRHAAVSHPVTIAGPTASFRTTAGVAGQPTTLDARASSDSQAGVAITTYAWSFGDGVADTGPSATASHVYGAQGSYPVILTVTDAAGDSSSVSGTVTVGELAPTASFSVDPAGAGSGQPVTFDASGSTEADGTIISYDWDFGDGSTGAGERPVHVYGAPGTYTATLTVENDVGQTATTTQWLTVAGPAAAVAGPATAIVGRTLAFDGTQSSAGPGSALTYSWSFGDGASASGATATHAYAATGMYTVTLTVTNELGQSDTTSWTVTVRLAPPTAAFTIGTGATVASTAQPVSFDGRGSGGGVIAYTWRFGDGGAASGATATHQYTFPGTYTATLTVTGSDEQTATISQTITVDAPPVAAFSLAPTGSSGALSFDARSSSEPQGGVAIAAYAWNFGDGTVASGDQATHAYSQPGTYTVTLTVTNSLGLTDTTTGQVDVAPNSAFVMRGDGPLAGSPVRFDGAPSGSGITAYTWNFGDGSSAGRGVSPTHVYRSPGTYTVTLTVTDASGQRSSVRGTVRVAPAPRITAVHVRRTGARTVLLVSVNAAGRLTVGRTGVELHRPGTARLRLRLSSAQTRALALTGVTRIRAAIDFAPQDGPASARSITVTVLSPSGRAG